MEIVLENDPSSSSSPSTPCAASPPQLGLPPRLHPPHHRGVVYDAGLRRSPPLLSSPDDYYARTRHGLASPSVVTTVRRVDKSGLLEIAETDRPVTCPRPCVLTGAEDITARAVSSLRIDRSGLLEAVPEAADQPDEQHGGNDERAPEPVDARGEHVDATSQQQQQQQQRAFEVGGCLLAERPSSLEGQACPDEADARVHSADNGAATMPVSGSPRYDVSKATERLSHLPFSPALSLRRLGNDPPRGSPDANATTPGKHAQPPRSPRNRAGCPKGAAEPSDSLLLTRKSERQDDPPGEERAEAEGCEHTAVGSLEEDKVSSFKGSNKLLDGDNVQTLRVIILSEQL